ncbi:MAG: helix-turn-helix transcriptional regulator [Clostridia bacterium]|nr:helix-turn-helix transcriptional regulator [Clostridia bacterium]
MNNLEIVVATQEYIKLHHNDADFSIENICKFIGYSRRQLDRLFRKFLQTTLYEYINAIVLSKSAEKLINTDSNVLDVALDSHFTSHEGYTRSFSKRFSVNPDEYRKSPIAIPLYIGHPANHYHILKEGREMESTSICTVIPVSRPKRNLIYLPSKSATGYLSYCEEVGCDWEGLQNSIPEKFDTAAILELPDFLQEDGYSNIASGVEVPLDYTKPLPDGYKIAELPECTMLYFQSEPYDNPDDFGVYIGQVYKALENYNFERYGYKLAENIAPTFNFGAQTDVGARIAVPVCVN